MIQIVNLTCDYRCRPIDVCGEAPLFGFQLQGDTKGGVQESWRIQVAPDPMFSTLCWDSRVQYSTQRAGIAYEGAPLCSAQRYYWRVFVTMQSPVPAATAQDYFETTLLHSTDWVAPWIAQSEPITPNCNHAVWLKGSIPLLRSVAWARLYITAKGLYCASINATPVTDALLTPGFTVYHKNLLFQTYDVTELLQEGSNTLLIHLAYGWYGRLGTWPGQAPYGGQRAAAAAQLEIVEADGTRRRYTTDEAWQWRYSNVVSASLYDGEIVRNLEDNVWKPIALLPNEAVPLHPQDGPPVRAQECFPAVEKKITPLGEIVFDFGQNLSGYVRIWVQGKKGEIVRVRHAETLDQAGNFYTENLRGAQQRLEYTLEKDGAQLYTPQFTFFGFRYLCVDAFPEEPTLENFTAVAIYSQMPCTMQFSCSDKKIQQLVKNAQWGMKSNSVDLPTDCPQRDERLGWTGDALAFCSSGAYLMQTPLFYHKWLHDMRESQYSDGALPNTIPDMFNDHTKVTLENRNCHSAAGWAEASILCPLVQYRFFADAQALEQNFSMMQRYIEYVARRAVKGVLWEGDEQFGDWLALDAAQGSYEGATPKDYVATAFFAGANVWMVAVCNALGRDASHYATQYSNICAALQKKYFNAQGTLQIETQTACVLALQFGFSPAPQRTAAQLAHLVQENKHTLTTGFLGTPFLCQALFDYGYPETALTLLHQEAYPSWLYAVNQGATTIWEHWDSIRPDGSMWSADMNSLNHYAYGSICDFIFSRLVGLQWETASPGFVHFALTPFFPPNWEDCSLRYAAVSGDIVIAWQRNTTGITLQIEIPCGSSATLALPNTAPQKIFGGSYTFEILQWI